jgi:hypothetical protein
MGGKHPHPHNAPAWHNGHRDNRIPPDNFLAEHVVAVESEDDAGPAVGGHCVEERLEGVAED